MPTRQSLVVFECKCVYYYNIYISIVKSLDELRYYNESFSATDDPRIFQSKTWSSCLVMVNPFTQCLLREMGNNDCCTMRKRVCSKDNSYTVNTANEDYDHESPINVWLINNGMRNGYVRVYSIHLWMSIYILPQNEPRFQRNKLFVSIFNNRSEYLMCFPGYVYPYNDSSQVTIPWRNKKHVFYFIWISLLLFFFLEVILVYY